MLLVLMLALCGCGCADLAVAAKGEVPILPAAIKVKRVNFSPQGPGSAGNTLLAGVQQCNSFRQLLYQLAAQPIPTASTLLESDTVTEEVYYTATRSAVRRRLVVFELTDFYGRWFNDRAGLTAGSVPTMPPDCTQLTRREVDSGSIYSDGVRVDYNSASRIAKRVRDPQAHIPRPIAPPLVTADKPKRVIKGQTCSVNAGTSAVGSAAYSCIWDDYGRVRYLGVLPIALVSTYTFGSEDNRFELTTLELGVGEASVPTDAFDLPPGYQITEGPTPPK